MHFEAIVGKFSSTTKATVGFYFCTENNSSYIITYIKRLRFHSV